MLDTHGSSLDRGRRTATRECWSPAVSGLEVTLDLAPHRFCTSLERQRSGPSRARKKPLVKGVIES